VTATTGHALDAHVELQRGTLRVDIELHVAAEEMVVLAGPNGAGKSTLLNAIAGLAPIDAGHITLDGVVLDSPATGVFVPPEKRPVSMMFQEGLLFRHLDALDNVAFGLRARGMRKSAANDRARALLARMGLADEEHAKPHQLSGGQAQRVALARALAVEPRALLLDEPLAALDAQTRVDVRRSLREHLATFDGVRLLVTHDPLEALTLADRIIVIESGRVVQSGAPDEIRRDPGSAYVAALLGVNLLAGRVTEGNRFLLDAGGELEVAAAPSGPAVAVVDPNAVAIFAGEPHGSPRNSWRSVVTDVDHTPDRVRVRFADPIAMIAEVTPSSAAELGLAPGAGVWLAVKATAISVHPR
jgi:molybdate transport system ATP-binding protein